MSYQAFSFAFVIMIPFSILITACVKVYRQKLLRSTESMYKGRLKVMTFYFVRIIISFLLIWLPGAIAYMTYWSLKNRDEPKIVAYSIFLLIVSFQSIVNFGCFLSKPDVYALVIALLKCEHCLQWHEVEEENVRSSFADESYRIDPYLGRLSSIALPKPKSVRDNDVECQ